MVEAKADDELIGELSDLVAKNPCGFFNVIRNSRPDLMEFLMERTQFLEESSGVSERTWYVLSGVTEKARCCVCGGEIRRKIGVGLLGHGRLYCSSCSQKKAETLEKAKATRLKNHGDPNWNNREKASRTCVERYGVENPFQSEDSKLKSRKTKAAGYGDPNWNNPEKAKATVAEMVAEDPSYWSRRDAKSRATKAKNRGDPTWNNPEKAAETNASRYGVACACQTEKAVEARGDAFERKYGDRSFFRTGYFRDIASKKAAESNRRRFYAGHLAANAKVAPAFSEDEYAALGSSAELKWKCLRCGAEFTAQCSHNDFQHFGAYARCPSCEPFTAGSSGMEDDLFAFVSSLAPDAAAGSRSVIPPYELDVVVPSKKIAFEFDGLYYHSTLGGKEPGYHAMKTSMCEETGYRLVHVFEDEWLEKRPIVESRIGSLLGAEERRVFARRCETGAVSPKAASEFLSRCHIQGACQSSARLGLYDEGELVALMTFGRCRFSKKCEWELLRYCSDLGVRVVGGAGRLLKAFERKYGPKSLLSYADRRWSQGGLYEALGFRLDHISPPAYWYVKSQKRYSRVKFQKSRLKALLPSFDPAKTEVENMVAAGYTTIFDCGNLVYVKAY